MDFRIVFRDWLDVLVPSVFSTNLLDSLLLNSCTIDCAAVLMVKASGESLVSGRLESTVVSL